MRRSLPALLGILLTTGLANAADVSLYKGESTVRVLVGEEVLGVYNFGEEWTKPFLAPLSGPGGMDLLRANVGEEPADEYAPGARVYVADEGAELERSGGETQPLEPGEILKVGEISDRRLFIPEKDGWVRQQDVIPLAAIVTRPIDLDPPGGLERTHPLYYDHPHHKGVWISVDEAGGIKFWNEDGRIENQSVEILEETGDPAVFRVRNHWLDEDGQPLLEETTTIQVHSNRLLVYDIQFEAKQEVTFDDTKEGMFAVRLTNSMRELVAGGPVVNADGVVGTGDAWGRTSSWVDYAGPVGDVQFGVTLMDHPDNFRPSRYHVRNYGLFGINPFGERAYTGGAEEAKPVTLQPGETLGLRYGLYVHRGGVEEGQVPAVYERFVELPR